MTIWSCLGWVLWRGWSGVPMNDEYRGFNLYGGWEQSAGTSQWCLRRKTTDHQPRYVWDKWMGDGSLQRLLRCNNPLANFWKIAEYCESGPAPCRLVVRVTAEKTGELMARSKEKNWCSVASPDATKSSWRWEGRRLPSHGVRPR